MGFFLHLINKFMISGLEISTDFYGEVVFVFYSPL